MLKARLLHLGFSSKALDTYNESGTRNRILITRKVRCCCWKRARSFIRGTTLIQFWILWDWSEVLEAELFKCCILLHTQIVNTSNGLRSKCYLNGSPTSLQILRDVGNLLVDVNNQNSSQSIREPRTQVKLLDSIARITRRVSCFGEKFSRMQALEEQVLQERFPLYLPVALIPAWELSICIYSVR